MVVHHRLPAATKHARPGDVDIVIRGHTGSVPTDADQNRSAGQLRRRILTIL